jgi:glycosyltransferase involved in cell wall biosynthesis
MNAASVSISICIPVFNQDVRKLMEQLMEQASRIALPIEIILAEDGSTGLEATYNRDFVQGTNIVYMHEETNIGRSAIRNLLAKHSKGTYLLYLDGDSSIENPHFLENYFRQIEAHPEAVLCGEPIFSKTYACSKIFVALYVWDKSRGEASFLPR